MDYAFLVQAGSLGSTGRELSFGFGAAQSFTGIESGLKIVDLDWHLVSLAHDADAGMIRFGLNGNYETQPVPKPVYSSSAPLYIGAHENAAGVNNQFLRGSVDEARYTPAFL